MPNWCCNRLRVSGRSEDIGQVRALFAGGGYPSYARAAAEGVQLFLAGCAGVLRPDGGAHYAPYPALTGTKGYPSCAGEGRDGHNDVTVEHWYAEQGCDFRGYARYAGGVQTESFSDSLGWSDANEDDEDACPEVTGPAWIQDNVAHFGG
ncbi:hypothetical protein [Pantoea sp. App145]|uniref:DUF1281 domain-containing protein n=1 Tax=Pantoea sp. App145 TaxID=3071567 RepID=UPI003A800EC4